MGDVLPIVIGRASRFTPFPHLTDHRESPRMLLPEASDDVTSDDCYKSHKVTVTSLLLQS